MKSRIMSLVMVLAFALPASAAVKEFDSFTMDVPDGWLVHSQDPVVVAASLDTESVITVVVTPSQGMSAKELAETAAQGINGTDLKADGDAWSLQFENEGQKGTMVIRVEKEQAIICTLIGQDPALAGIPGSVTLK